MFILNLLEVRVDFLKKNKKHLIGTYELPKVQTYVNRTKIEPIQSKEQYYQEYLIFCSLLQ